MSSKHHTTSRTQVQRPGKGARHEPGPAGRASERSPGYGSTHAPGRSGARQVVRPVGRAALPSKSGPTHPNERTSFGTAFARLGTTLRRLSLPDTLLRRLPFLQASSTARRQRRGRSRRRLSLEQKIGLGIVAAVAILALIFWANARAHSTSGSGADLAGRYRYDVAQPGPGQLAPAFTLPATDGTTIDFASLHGKTVLLYFHEGIGCEPCWDQLKDIERNQSAFQQLGIDQIISITTNPLGALKQKVADEALHTPVLADERFTASLAYHANEYGMMGKSADGHSFILVGPDGRIRWRADYGGPPEYTMYVPIPNLVADIQEGIHGNAAEQ